MKIDKWIYRERDEEAHDLLIVEERERERERESNYTFDGGNNHTSTF